MEMYEVEVFGQTFTVSDDRGKEHLEAVVQAADRRIREIGMKVQAGNPVRVAIMALMQAEAELIEAWKWGKGWL